MHDVLFGSTVLAAFIGGVVALFAPCCISVMLPAYFATGFRRRRALVAMTFVFGLGVATVILPIAFGASAVTRFVLGHHLWVFLGGAVLMIGLGLATIAGWKLPLPAPSMAPRREKSPGAVYALGLFSGTATACCAPVLAGVVALSGEAGSFLAASIVGVAYVFGMVAPLFAVAALWDRRDWADHPLLRSRRLTVRALGRSLTVESSALVAGVVLIVMGVLAAILAFTGTDMARTGWQATLTARLQHYGKVVLSWASGLPGWAGIVLIAALVAVFAHTAVRQYLDDADRVDGESDPDHDGPTEPRQHVEEALSRGGPPP